MKAGVDEWFAEYLAVFAACGRGERPAADVLAFYAIPLLLTSDDVAVSLGSTDEISSWVQGQVDGMLAAKYADTVVLAGGSTILNRNTALYRGEFSRRSRDGSEISTMTVTYLITGSPEERVISALVLHSASDVQS